MKINGTITTKSGRWSGIKNHTDRNYKNDKNKKSINNKLTRFNRQGYEINVDKTLKRHYLPWLKKNNAHQRSTGHSERQKTFDEFKTGKKLTNLAIATFGTVDDKMSNLDMINNNYPNLSPKQVKRRYYQAVSWGLKHYMHHYNDRNKYAPVGHFETNVDEEGAPHVHFELIPLGFTKKGKPSGNLSNALKKQYSTNDRREAFRKWNNQETNAIVQSVGSVLSKRFSKVPEFQSWELQHTGRKHSLSMESYKETQKHFDKERERLNKQRDLVHRQVKESRHITSELPELRSKHHSLTVGVDSLISHKSSLKDDIQNLKGQYHFSKKRQQKWSNLSVSEQNRLYNLKDSVSKLTTKKKNLKKYLNNKWLAFKRKHLKGYYRGLAIGIKALNPHAQMNGFTFMDLATGYAKLGGRWGMSLFVHSLAHRASRYFNHEKSAKNIKKSFDNSTNDYDYMKSAKEYDDLHSGITYPNFGNKKENGLGK